MVAEVKAAVNEAVETAQPSLKESWVEVSNPILTDWKLRTRICKITGLTVRPLVLRPAVTIMPLFQI